MTELITSTQNPKIKRILTLRQKSSARRDEGVFLVEGRREAEHCKAAGFELCSVFFCPEIISKERIAALLEGCGPKSAAGAESEGRRQQAESQRERCKSAPRSRCQIFEVTREVYEKIACREGTEGFIAEVRARSLNLSDLRLPQNPLITVLESVEKPGNLGAVLRSADAAGADAVLICDPLTDLYNPNLVRASIGAAFTVPTVACTSSEAIAFLKERGIRILTAQLQDSSLYYDCDMSRGTALVMGTEATGLSQQWRLAADAHVRIPMLGALDSLNVSVSAAILLFEAVRQRQKDIKQ